MRTTLLATAFAALVTTAAFAETAVMPDGWSGGPIGNAFFNDDMTIRSQNDLKHNWTMLSADQQNQVRTDCKKLTSTVPNSTSKGGGTAQSSATAQPSYADLNTLCGMMQAM